MTAPDGLEWIGWVATAAFAASYLCREPATLRRVQALAALLWVAYGVIIHAAPVVVANVVVAAAAGWSAMRLSRRRRDPAGSESPAPTSPAPAA